ncbi:MAG: glycosyltransferase, partial [Proteobacteria bacterium]|nr:glycosyltransferase [Pseudomonadota bacterium]
GGLEIVLVNDGSRDESAAVCEGLVEKYSVPITFVNLARNFGEHNAVMAGLHHTRGEYVITMDDDMQNPPSEVIKLFNYARTSGKDVVYTFFQNKEHDSFRNFGSWLTNRAADMLLDKPKGF